MMKLIKAIKSALVMVIIAAVTFATLVTAMADANIGLTTSDGTADIAEDIEVTVQITSDDQIGTYYIELEYDSARMRYVSGAEREQDGILTLTGTGMSKTVRYDLKFTGATGGEAGMIVRAARVNDTAGNPVNTTDSGLLGIVVTGQADSSASFTQKLAEEEELFDSDLPVSGTIHDAAGNVYYVVDLTRTTPEIMSFQFDLVEETFEGQMISFAVDKNAVIKMLPLMDADDNVNLYAVNGDMFYPMTSHTDANGKKYVYVSMEACSTMPQKIASDTEMWDYAVYAVSPDGTGGFYLINGQGNLELYTVLNATTLAGAGLFSKVFSGASIPWERYLIIAAGVIILIIILVIILSVVFKSLKKRRIRKVADYQYDYSIEEPVDVDEDISDIDVYEKTEDAVKDAEKAPVSRRVKKAGIASENSKKVSQVSDIDSKPVRKKDVQEPEPEQEHEQEPEPDQAIDAQEGLSLDDIVLTSEDMPEDMRQSEADNTFSGTESISASEPDETPSEMEKTIRIDNIVLDDTNEINVEKTESSDDVDSFLENIEL